MILPWSGNNPMVGARHRFRSNMALITEACTKASAGVIFPARGRARWPERGSPIPMGGHYMPLLYFCALV